MKAKKVEKKHPANIQYINDNYRRQLNKAFLNFNPIIHLGNLNILRKADPEINSDIEKRSMYPFDSRESRILPVFGLSFKIIFASSL